jgi:hypothetical protein
LASSDNRRTRGVNCPTVEETERAELTAKPDHTCSTLSLCSTTGFLAACDPPRCCLLLRCVSNCCGLSRRPKTVAMRCALLRSAANRLRNENLLPMPRPKSLSHSPLVGHNATPLRASEETRETPERLIAAGSWRPRSGRQMVVPLPRAGMPPESRSHALQRFRRQNRSLARA